MFSDLHTLLQLFKTIFFMRIFITCCIVFFFGQACQKELPEQSAKVREENAYMQLMLDSIYENGRPQWYYHWNKKRAEEYRQIYERNQGSVPSMHMYGLELLFAGDTEKSIELLENVRESMDYSQLAKNRNYLIDLVVAYLRLAEDKNCVASHNGNACIIPLDETAIHQNTGGAEKALETIEFLREKGFENDLSLLWLENLARMTLGQDSELSLPLSTEKSDFPRFENIALKTGAGRMGLSGGVALEDFDGDGDIDIFNTSYGMQDPFQLLFNNGDGSFEDVTEKAGIAGLTSGLNCKSADYDNDGDYDIFITRGGWLGRFGNHPNSLLRNNGDGTFSDVTKDAGLLSFKPTQTAVWLDYNNDGWLDLFVGNEAKGDPKYTSELFENKGDGTFKEKSKQAGIAVSAFTKGVCAADINQDGWTDLYLSNYGMKNMLFLNESGKFREVADSFGVAGPAESFPCWFWDYDNDGDEDLFVASYYYNSERYCPVDYMNEINGKGARSVPFLYKNLSGKKFVNVSDTAKLLKSMFTMGCNFGDINNDGYLDFYAGTGTPHFISVVPNRMFIGNSEESFEEVSSAGGFGHIQKGHGVGIADFDLDGDQDVFAVMGGAYEADVFSNALFDNPGFGNHWVKLQLQGKDCNRSAKYSKVKLTFRENGRRREIHHTYGSDASFGGNPHLAHIGLGDAAKIDSILVYWAEPSNRVSLFEEVPADSVYRIVEDEVELKEISPSE